MREYARRRGCSPAAVSRAVKEGRLDLSVIGEGRRRRIDPAIADKEWARNTDHAKRPRSGGEESSDLDLSYAEARARREFWQAEKTRLEAEALGGSLVSAEKVKRDAFDLYRRHRNNLLSLPERLAADLAAEDDVHAVNVMLKEAITEALQEISSGIDEEQ